MHYSFVTKGNLHIRLLFVLNTFVSTQRYILFFSSVTTHCFSSKNLKWYIKTTNWYYLYHDVHHRRRNRARTEFASSHRFWNLFLSLWSFSKYKWLVVNSKDQAPTKVLTTHRPKIIPPPMVCTCMIQIEFQLRYSLMRVIEEKEMHASNLEDDEFNSVEGRQEMKRMHASTPKNNEFNSVEGRQEILRVWV